MEFLQDLCESRLFGGSKSNLHKYNAREIADLLLLHMCGLQILKSEFHGLPMAQKYVQQMGSLSTFDSWIPARNETYAMIYVLSGRHAGPAQLLLKDQEESQALLKIININIPFLRKYMRMIKAGQVDEAFERRFFLELEHDLRISNSYYRSIRRLASTWHEQEQSTKKLVLTRLLQVLRTKARRSELLAAVEFIAKKQNFEDKALNPMDSEGNSIAQKTPTHGFLKTLAATGLAAAAGGVAGYKLIRKK